MADAQWIVEDFAAALAQLESALAEPAHRALPMFSAALKQLSATLQTLAQP
jgi:hypothetical protein